MNEIGGAWLFGDIGRPILGPNSLNFLAKSIPGFSEWIKSLMKELVGGPARDKPTLRLEKQGKQFGELFAVMQHCRDLEGETLDCKAFVVSQADDFESVLLGNLPWTMDTWAIFRELGLSETDPIGVIEGLTWHEIFAAEKGFPAFFDIIQILNDWLPFAHDQHMLVNPEAKLEEIVRAFQVEIMARANFNITNQIVYQDLLERRNGWGVPEETLDELGASWALTRERVRQIESLLNLTVKSRTRDSWFLLKKLSKYEAQDKFANVMEDIRAEFSLNETWTIEALTTLLSALRDKSSAIRFEENVLPTASESSEHAKKIKALRDARSDFGVIKLDAVVDPVKKGFLPVEEAVILAQIAYGKVNHFGNYAIVSRQDFSAGIYSAIANQLQVCNPLHVDQILVGVTRAATQRNAQNTLPDRQTFVQLLKQSEDFDVSDTLMVSGREQEYDPGTIQRWLLDLICAQDGAVLSKAEVYREALLADVKLSSLNSYMTFQSTLRQAGKGLMTVVGNTPTNAQIDFANRVAEAKYVANTPIRIESLNSDQFQLKFTFSTPFFESGTVSSTELLHQLYGKDAKRIYCCPEFDAETNSYVNIKSNFLYGLAGAKDHLLYSHGYSEGDEVTLRISKESVTVIT